ncbi:MAG: FeoA domain-containing protein [Bdellovibrionota bacterium]
MAAPNLWSLRENQEAFIKDFCPSLLKHHQNRFIELGFRHGESVKCIKTPPFGAPHVFEVSDTVFSISKEDAVKIFLLTEQ